MLLAMWLNTSFTEDSVLGAVLSTCGFNSSSCFVSVVLGIEYQTLSVVSKLSVSSVHLLYFQTEFHQVP